MPIGWRIPTTQAGGIYNAHWDHWSVALADQGLLLYAVVRDPATMIVLRVIIVGVAASGVVSASPQRFVGGCLYGAFVVDEQNGGAVQLRAFRYALDPTDAQTAELARFAGAARWAFNHALAVKVAAHQQWRAEVAALVSGAVDEPAARRRVRVPVPSN